MKRNISRLLSLAAVCVLLVFALAACSEEEAPAQTQAPSVQTQAPAEETATPTPTPSPENLLPTATPVPTANADGELTYTSMSKGFSFRYNKDYIAISNQVDNAMIYPAGDTVLPYCSVALFTETDAVSYLNEIAAGTAIELEGSLSTAPGEPVSAGVEGRDIYTISYAYSDDDLGGTVNCVYYAENVAEGKVAVYSSTAMEADKDTVDGILKLAIDSFKID